MKLADDDTTIHFGAHAGAKLGSLTDDYLRYLWNDGFNRETKAEGKRGDLARYLLAALPDIGQGFVIKKKVNEPPANPPISLVAGRKSRFHFAARPAATSTITLRPVAAALRLPLRFSIAGLGAEWRPGSGRR